MLAQFTLLSLVATSAFGLEHAHHKHKFALFDEQLPTVHKRSSGTCAFPTDQGLVAVNEGGTGGGWAISKDRTCRAGDWCPYACPSGQLAAQWDPSVTSYTYPGSQYGGLKCNSDGTLSKPFSNKPYCYDGKGTLSAKNTLGENVLFCQTVLPGNEEMLIPTNVDGGNEETLAVPGTEYWAGTSAHYYVNPPGVSTSDGCTWGTSAKAEGNWSPYVVGVNQDDNKDTFVKIGWNPIYLDAFTSLPSFGLRITCDDESKCNGLKCEINPSNGLNSVSGSSTTGSGSANFCVVTASQGASAKVEIFSVGSGATIGGSKIANVVNKAVGNTTLTTAVASATANSNSSISATSTPSSKSNAAANYKANSYLVSAIALSVVLQTLL